VSDQSIEEAVLVERRGHVLIVTINRPKARNAVNRAVHMGIGGALEEANNDPEIRAVIITGAGDQAFCAGADLKALARGENLMPDDPTAIAWGFAGYVSHPIHKPTIAAVNGFALGGGTELTLASDLAVAADTAHFGLPEVKRGILAGAGGAFRIGRQLPPKLAMEMLLTGDPIDARRAAEIGLVNAVVPQAEVLSASLALAARIVSNAPLSVQASKRIARGITDGEIESEVSAWKRTRDESLGLMKSEDAREGPRAFAEKRPPVWKAC
jgi:crotonobetainyl-CoA hydratase